MRAPRGVFVGLATLDVIQRVSRLPGPDEKVVADRTDLAAGGPATGAAVTFAALGGDAELVTALGSGPLADMVRADLARHGVRVRDVAPGSGAGPALSSVTVLDSTGERSVVSRNAEGIRATAPADLDELVGAAQVLLLDGHHPHLAVPAARAAHQQGVTVVLDAGSWKPVTQELAPLSTMAICSSAFRMPDSAEPGPRLLGLGAEFVAVTAGAGPIRWWTREGHGTVVVPNVRARDTLGAGDVFHGAYAHAVAAGTDRVEALDLAAGVAAIRVSSRGPRAWLDDPGLERFAARTSPRPAAPGGGA